jgi:hypothetical protein
MARWLVRHHDDAPSAGRGLLFLAVGLVAGVAAGAYLAHRLGGVTGISARVRRGLGAARQPAKGPLPTPAPPEPGAGLGIDDDYDAYGDGNDDYDEEDFARAELTDDEESDEMVSMSSDREDEDDMMADDDAEPFASADPELEDRVLTAFTNDPVLCERAIDIGAVSAGTIELTGGVYTDVEYERATIVTRGVPGVDTVVNRLSIRDDEASEDRSARRYATGDPRYTESQWENERVGTGRPRQGTSQDVGRHADPKLPLESRALDEAEAIRDAADDLPADRRTTGVRKNRDEIQADQEPG